MSDEHELSIEGLERIVDRIDEYKSNETKCREDTWQIEIKKMHNVFTCSNEVPYSTMENNEFGEVIKLLFYKTFSFWMLFSYILKCN